MRAKLIRAPWWVLALVTGGFFTLFTTLSHRFREGDSWGQALVVGLLGGLERRAEELGHPGHGES